MPPKKNTATPTILIGEFDVELMTQNELKMYVEALQEEHERMRKARNLYQKDNSELLNFLSSLQDDIIHNKKIIMQKNLELQDQMLEQEKKLKFEDELVTIMKMENINQEEKSIVETYINLITTKIHNKEKEQELLNNINEIDREIEDLEFVYELISIQSKGKNLAEQTKANKTSRNSFEDLITDNLINSLKTREKFYLNKIENLQAIWGEIPITENNPFSSEIAKMTTYFKDIYLKNIKTIKKLQFVLDELEKELKYITSNIRDIRKERSDLVFEDFLLSPRPSLISTLSICPEKLKKLEELTCENYLLRNKLEMAMKEHYDLKKKFAFAIRRIYQIADFKAFFLEKKLNTRTQSYPRRFA